MKEAPQPPHRPPPPAPRGLSTAEAARRLAQDGPNTIEDRETRGLWGTLREVSTEPMFLLLLVAAALYLALGDLAEGLLLGFFALVTVGLVIFQARRSEHALDALRAMAAPQVRVWRDGELRRLPAAELVRGDWIVLAEGERVAADARLIDAVALSVDESLLTGESVAVDKAADAAPAGPAADDPRAVWAGTLVVAGHGLAEVLSTGARTRMGRIGASLATIETGATPLQVQLKVLVRSFGVLALVSTAALLLGYGLWRGDWKAGWLAAIALGMAMLPEEFPMALSVFLALGAWRMARLRVLARRPAVIEALGAVSVLCTDKTGTLTENRMRLQRLVNDTHDFSATAGAPLPEAVHGLLEAAMLASRRGSSDPMDRAIFALGDAGLAGTEHLHPSWQETREFPLTSALRATSHRWSDEQGRQHIAAKGAPEAVAALCHLGPAESAALQARVEALAREGLRVLAVASGVADARGLEAPRDPGALLHDRLPGTPPDTPPDLHDHHFVLRGLLGFEDPLREGVPAAVAQAREAGIAVAMITGDHAATALAIATRAGLDTQHGALEGSDIDALDDAALCRAAQRVRVFARVAPEQKLRLVRALRSAPGQDGQAEAVVAMTGDGVNDAPALKAAHVGIAMGGRGTDVAREAAALVLLDDDFTHIVAGVRLGRRIFDNLRRVMTYITAIHVPIAGLSLLPLLFGFPPLMLPAHVVLTEMVIDPVCSLAFEGAPEDPRIMQRPPRPAAAGLVDASLWGPGLLQGALLLLATFGAFWLAMRSGRGEDSARTLAVLGLTAGNLMLVAVNLGVGLGWRALFMPGARAFWTVAAAAGAILGFALAWPPARRLLQFELPRVDDLAFTLAGVLAASALAAWLTRAWVGGAGSGTRRARA